MYRTLHAIIEKINTYCNIPQLKWIKLVSVRDALNAIKNNEVEAFGWKVSPKNGITVFNKEQTIFNEDRLITIVYIHEDNKVCVHFKNKLSMVSFDIVASNGKVETEVRILDNY